MTAPTSPAGVRTPNRAVATDRYETLEHTDETKASFKTTELWAAIIGVVAVIVVYNATADPSLNLWRTCLLAVVLGASYIVSRGIAKSGSQRHDREPFRGYQER